MSKSPTNSKFLFAVYMLAMGSLVLGEHKLMPFEIQRVPAGVKDLACPRTTPVKFFVTREDAEAEVRALRAGASKASAPQLE